MSSTSLSDTIFLKNGDVSSKNKTRYLIVFVTGNPGLIEYYRAFLTHLFSLLNPSPKSETDFDIYGSSLVGFEFADKELAAAKWEKLGLNHPPPFSLDEVIDGVESDIWSVVGKNYNGVIVMGHSLGSYITLEIIQRHRWRLDEGGIKEVRIVGGVCLFPTVMEIAMSARGKVLTTLSSIPFFQSLIPSLCSLILILLPTSVISFIVNRIDGLHGHAAVTTTSFLKSPYGVSQALFMGRDEMQQISTNKWDHEIWGAAHPSQTGHPRPKLFFHFGEKDHWVADRTREDIMKARGRNAEVEHWKPKMEIDGKGIPHGFCISHSIPIAEKVKEYIDEIVEHDRQ